MNALQLSYWWSGQLGCSLVLQPHWTKCCSCSSVLWSTLSREEPTQCPQGTKRPPRSPRQQPRHWKGEPATLDAQRNIPHTPGQHPGCWGVLSKQPGKLCPREAKAAGRWPTESNAQGWNFNTWCSKTQKVPGTLCLLNRSWQWTAEKIRIILLMSFSKFCHLPGNEPQTLVAALPDRQRFVPVCSVAETGLCLPPYANQHQARSADPTVIEYKFCLHPFYQSLHDLFLSLFPSIPSHKMLQAKGKSIVIKRHLQTESGFFPKAPGYLSFITCLRRGHHSLTTNIWPKRPPHLKKKKKLIIVTYSFL